MKYKRFGFVCVESPAGTHARTDIHTCGTYDSDRLRHVFRSQTTGQENRNGHPLTNALADGPVVSAPGTAQYLDGARRPARVQQKHVGRPCHDCGLIDRRFIHHVDHLDQKHTRQIAPQFIMCAFRQTVA